MARLTEHYRAGCNQRTLAAQSHNQKRALSVFNELHESSNLLEFLRNPCGPLRFNPHNPPADAATNTNWRARALCQTDLELCLSAIRVDRSISRHALAVDGGQVLGSSDKDGAYPKDFAVEPGDLLATLYHSLGIDPQTEIHDPLNRPHPISRGRVLDRVF